jgi:hypothetical protein
VRTTAGGDLAEMNVLLLALGPVWVDGERRLVLSDADGVMEIAALRRRVERSRTR